MDLRSDRRFNTVVLPVTSVSLVELALGAYLHSRYPINLKRLRFDLSLHGTELRGIFRHQPEERELLETALELLKLLGYQNDTLTTGPPHGRRQRGEQPCRRAREACDSHLIFGIKRNSLEDLILGVSHFRAKEKGRRKADSQVEHSWRTLRKKSSRSCRIAFGLKCPE